MIRKKTYGSHDIFIHPEDNTTFDKLQESYLNKQSSENGNSTNKTNSGLLFSSLEEFAKIMPVKKRNKNLNNIPITIAGTPVATATVISQWPSTKKTCASTPLKKTQLVAKPLTVPQCSPLVASDAFSEECSENGNFIITPDQNSSDSVVEDSVYNDASREDLFNDSSIYCSTNNLITSMEEKKQNVFCDKITLNDNKNSININQFIHNDMSNQKIIDCLTDKREFENCNDTSKCQVENLELNALSISLKHYQLTNNNSVGTTNPFKVGSEHAENIQKSLGSSEIKPVLHVNPENYDTCDNFIKENKIFTNASEISSISEQIVHHKCVQNKRQSIFIALSHPISKKCINQNLKFKEETLRLSSVRFICDASLNGSSVDDQQFNKTQVCNKIFSTNIVSEKIDIWELPLQDRILKLCLQDNILNFMDWDSSKVKKISEGQFGEVFTMSVGTGKSSVFKIVPIVNISAKDNQMLMDEVFSEILIAKKLNGLLQFGSNFVHAKSTYCVQGCYPDKLLFLWDKFKEENGTENVRPDNINESQVFIIFELEDSGTDLENYTLKNSCQALSVFLQVLCSLAMAEENLHFEHRDLHWGNLLLQPASQTKLHYYVGNREFLILSENIQVTIIDFTLSRLNDGNYIVFSDMSDNPWLFNGEGDYQFDIYREMKKHLRGCLAGVLVGDCMGAPFEGQIECISKFAIKHHFKRMVMPGGKAPFTDDASMTFALAESLIEMQRFDIMNIAKKFADTYFENPNRGYGSNVVKVFAALKNPELEDIFQPAKEQLRGHGSYGNGAAMRVAAIPLFYKNNLQKAVEMAQIQAKLTHSHPDGIAGAALQEYSSSEESIVVNQLGNNIAATGSIPTAIYCFLRSFDIPEIEGIRNSFEKALMLAISLGGDTDTIASMTGAIMGAYLGIDVIPTHFLEACEGSKHAIALADKLFHITS